MPTTFHPAIRPRLWSRQRLATFLNRGKNHAKLHEFRTFLLHGCFRNGTPKSSILIGFSIINHPFWGTPILGNTHMFSPKFIIVECHWDPCKDSAKRARHIMWAAQESISLPFQFSWNISISNFKIVNFTWPNCYLVVLQSCWTQLRPTMNILI